MTDFVHRASASLARLTSQKPATAYLRVNAGACPTMRTQHIFLGALAAMLIPTGTLSEGDSDGHRPAPPAPTGFRHELVRNVSGGPWAWISLHTIF